MDIVLWYQLPFHLVEGPVYEYAGKISTNGFTATSEYDTDMKTV